MRFFLAYLATCLCASAANLIPNSSFEIGAGRGWVSWGGNAFFGNPGSINSFITNDAVHGKYSMKVASEARLMGRGVWLASGTYTFTVSLRASSAAGPIYYGMLGYQDIQAGVNPPSGSTLATSWARFTNTFTATSNAFYYPKFYTLQNVETFVDAIQLEAGSTATAYAPQSSFEVGITIPNTNNLWFAGDAPQFNLNYRNEGAATNAVIGYTIYDLWNSNVVSAAVTAPFLAGTNGTVLVNMPARNGWFRIVSRLFSFDDSYDEATTIVYPYASNVTANATSDWLGGHPHASQFHVRRELLTAKRWGRLLSPLYSGTRWDYIEPTRGNFTFNDYAFTNLSSEGLLIVAPLTPTDAIWPTWATNANGSADLVAWSNYCYQVVSRYKTYCTHWEIGPNEPLQTGPTTPIHVQVATNYATVLTWGLGGVTNADPTAKIIAMAGAYGNGDWAKEVWTNLTTTSQGAITYLSTHNYGDLSGDPNVPYGSQSKSLDAKGWITNFAGIRPVWNTESGTYGVGPIKGLNGLWPVALDMQNAAYPNESWRAEPMTRQQTSTVRILTEALRSIGYGFQKFFYYDSRFFNDQFFNGSQPYPADYMQVDRPEIASLSIATHFITKGFGKVANTSDATIEMYSYTNSIGQAVVAAWNDSRTNKTLTLSSPLFALYDCMGNLVQTNSATARTYRLPQYFVSGSLTTVQLSNALVTATVAGYVDNTAPMISIDVAPSGVWPGGNALLKWTALDDTWTAWGVGGSATATNILTAWKLDSAAYSVFSQTNFVWVNGLAAGNHTLWVKAQDGNLNTSETNYVFASSQTAGASGNSAGTGTVGTVIVNPPP